MVYGRVHDHNGVLQEGPRLPPQGRRECYQFDTGMATAFIILRTMDLGLVTHPIAGYEEAKAKEVLGIPEEMTVITLVIVGRHSETMGSLLSDKQEEIEGKRWGRLSWEELAYFNRFQGN